MAKVSQSGRGNTQAGFTILELLVSIALLMVIGSAAIGGLNYFQRNYRADEERKSLQTKLRATVEQMTQEIGQAGVVPSGLTGNGAYNPTVLSSLATVTALNSTSTPNTLTVTTANSLYPGEWIILDTPDLNSGTGAPEERVQISSITNNNDGSAVLSLVSGNGIKQTHTIGASNPVPIMAQGVYPAGVWTTTTVPNPTTNTAATLTIFGDINANGKMVVVKYVCPATFPGKLLRNEYSSSNSTCAANAVPDLQTTMIDNVTACQFTYKREQPTGSSNYYARSVGVSITVQSQSVDPQSHNYITVTKNVLNIQPRNISNAYNMETTPLTGNTGLDSYTMQLQTLPTSSALSSPSIFTSDCIP